MTTPTSVANLNGLYKQTYAQKIENSVPGAAHLLKKIPFSAKDRVNGSFYNQPVILSQEQGWTYFPPGSSVLTLNGSVSMSLPNAQVIGGYMVGQCQMGYETAERAQSGGETAFRDAIGLQMVNMIDSGKKRQEFNFLYGQTAIALVGSNTAINATSTTLNIVLSEYAAGFWSGLQNAQLDVYGGGSQLNTNGPINVAVSNVSSNTVTVSGVAADITAINNYANSSNGFANTSNAASVWFYGTQAGAYESPGVKTQLTNRSTLFNINAAQYDLWNGNIYNANGSLTFETLQKAVSVAASRGLDEDVDVYVNPNTWADLLNEQQALRRYYTGGNGELKTGADGITFQGQNGLMKIYAHIFVKNGDAFVLPMSRVSRIGAQPMSFSLPGTDKGTVFFQIPGIAGFEYRCYAQETLFIDKPAACVYINGIVN